MNAEGFTGSALRRLRTSVLTFSAATALAFAATAGTALAQDAYPNKTVRILIPFSPGGAADTLARIVADALGKHWGQSVIVENRAGGNTIIGTAAAVKSAPDGYTLLFAGDQSITINPALGMAQPYSVEKDLAPISLIALNPSMLAVTIDTPAKSVQEFVALAKKKPKEITYGSSGPGSIQRLSMELLAQQAGIELIHVPFRGSNETVAAMLGNNINATINGVSNFMQLHAAGKVRLLATSSARRAKQVPEVPTVREAGGPELKNYEALSWFGMLAPSGVPQAIRDRIQADLVKVLRTPEMEKTLETRGFELVVNTAGEFGKIIADDTAKWRDVIRKGNIKAE
jgi:tripartite-type tricarboxylate transporter receptor subunit TctC